LQLVKLDRPWAAALILASSLFPAAAAELILAEVKSNVVPSPVPYAVLMPDGFPDWPVPGTDGTDLPRQHKSERTFSDGHLNGRHGHASDRI
jgi:hypothetical protein